MDHISSTNSSNSSSNSRNETIARIAVTVGFFCAIFLTAQVLLTVVYGYGDQSSPSASTYDFENSTAYKEVMNATTKAANMTEGIALDLYVENVADQICLIPIPGPEYKQVCIVQHG